MQHILIVEDDLDIQDLLRNFLQEVGYEITIASDGMEAIALFSWTMLLTEGLAHCYSRPTAPKLIMCVAELESLPQRGKK